MRQKTMTIVDFFELVREGNCERVLQTLSNQPELLWARNPNAGKDDQPDWDEVNVMHSAAKRGHLDLIRTFVSLNAEVYSNPTCTYPPVMLAHWSQHEEVVRYFLKEIPNLAYGTNGLGVTCNLAGRAGWGDLVKAHILADPLVVHQRGWIGDTPLHWPAHNGFETIVDDLLRAGADPNAHVLHWVGGTPLHWASEKSPAIVRKMLAAGSRVNEQVILEGSTLQGATPLICCARQKDDCADCAHALLDQGADPSIADAFGKRAIDYARERGHKRVAQVLDNWGPSCKP